MLLAAQTHTYQEGYPVRKLAEDFKSFLIKGDLVSITVGLVMALVFAVVVKALIADLITPTSR